MDVMILHDFNYVSKLESGGSSDPVYKEKPFDVNRTNADINKALQKYIPEGDPYKIDYGKMVNGKLDINLHHATSQGINIRRYTSQSGLGAGASGKLRFYLNFG
jgi:hypothetical protein